jgi:hypothetical protein
MMFGHAGGQPWNRHRAISTMVFTVAGRPWFREAALTTMWITLWIPRWIVGRFRCGFWVDFHRAARSIFAQVSG